MAFEFGLEVVTGQEVADGMAEVSGNFYVMLGRAAQEVVQAGGAGAAVLASALGIAWLLKKAAGQIAPKKSEAASASA